MESEELTNLDGYSCLSIERQLNTTKWLYIYKVRYENLTFISYMKFLIRLSYIQFWMVQGIPWIIMLIIVLLGLSRMPSDPMPYVLFLILRAAGICAFLKAIIYCGWWWGFVTAAKDKFPEIVGQKVHQIKLLIGLLFFCFIAVSFAFFFNWILYLLEYRIIGIAVIGMLFILVFCCGFALRSFLIKTLRAIATKRNETIDEFNFSFLNPFGGWAMQKMVSSVFKGR